jgi:AcrR family transcriptional regulator
MARTGRRPGPSTTRAAILSAARRRFADEGYNATSLRAIAADAGVDPGVVLHFFGSKDDLFQAAVGWPFDPARLAPRFIGPDAHVTGARVARTFLDLWDDPATRASLEAVLRSAMSHPESARLLREFVVHELFARLVSHLDGADAGLRANLAAAQLIGVAILRYIVRIEPLASASTDTLVTWLAPTLDRYFEPERTDQGAGELP